MKILSSHLDSSSEVLHNWKPSWKIYQDRSRETIRFHVF